MSEPSTSSLAFIHTATLVPRKGSQQQRWKLGLDVDGKPQTMTAFQEDLDALSYAGWSVGYWLRGGTYTLKCKIPVNVTPDSKYQWRIDRDNVSPAHENYEDSELAADQTTREVRGPDLQKGDVVMFSVEHRDGRGGDQRTYYHYRLLEKPRKVNDDVLRRSIMEAQIEYLDNYHSPDGLYPKGDTRTIDITYSGKYSVLNYEYAESEAAA